MQWIIALQYCFAILPPVTGGIPILCHWEAYQRTIFDSEDQCNRFRIRVTLPSNVTKAVCWPNDGKEHI